MERKEDIGFNIRKLANLIKRDVESSKCRLGIDKVKGINGWVIDYFYQNRDKVLFQKDFEEHFSIRPPTASKILKSMEQKEYIKRVSVEADARLKRIFLTDKAIKLHEEIILEIKEREARLRRNITEEELKVFFDVMNKLSANMENDYD